MTRKTRLVKAQVKSRFYYWFWGTTAVAVVSGQLYVGSSYRIMAKSMNRWFEETIEIMQMPLTGPRDGRGYYQPIPSSPEDYERYPIIQ